MPLSPKIKEYLLAKTNPAYATVLSLEKVREIAKQTAKDVVEKEIEEIKIKAENEIVNILLNLKGLSAKQLANALKGDKGEKPIAGVDFPIPKDGDNYILTEADKNEIAKKIDVPIVEKLIEKTETIIEKPIITEIVKEKALKDTPDEVVEKINKAKEKIDKNQIKGLREMLKGGKKGGSGLTVNYSDLSSQCDGSNKTFTVPYHSRSIALLGTQFPIVYRPTTDYTISGTNLTLTAEVNGPENGQTLVFLFG